MALAHAVRAEDGRGDPTVLQQRVPRFFGMRTAAAVTEALYLGKLAPHRLVELSPLVFMAARDRDRIARSILDRVADEVVAFANAAIKRLRIANRDVEIVLGGGIFRAEDVAFHRRIHSGIHRLAPRAQIRRLTAPPVVGAALLGLDIVQASPEAVLRLRDALTYPRLS
jgi:N-acetylglucosamine kinase-like BadF-type ATPase